ncbi:MAG: hypothetical protein MK180_18785, partial [Rhodobacteraceae bacterium]|nr:hypothetical protein [Paracoccaceae bacterium]
SFGRGLVSFPRQKRGLSSPAGAESPLGNAPEENFGKLFLCELARTQLLSGQWNWPVGTKRADYPVNNQLNRAGFAGGSNS